MNRIPIFRPSSTLNGPSTATVSRLAPIGTHFPVYGENIDYAIRIVEHFMHLLPGGKSLFLFVPYLGQSLSSEFQCYS